MKTYGHHIEIFSYNRWQSIVNIFKQFTTRHLRYIYMPSTKLVAPKQSSKAIEYLITGSQGCRLLQSSHQRPSTTLKQSPKVVIRLGLVCVGPKKVIPMIPQTMIESDFILVWVVHWRCVMVSRDCWRICLNNV